MFVQTKSKKTEFIGDREAHRQRMESEAAEEAARKAAHDEQQALLHDLRADGVSVPVAFDSNVVNIDLHPQTVQAVSVCVPGWQLIDPSPAVVLTSTQSGLRLEGELVMRTFADRQLWFAEFQFAEHDVLFLGNTTYVLIGADQFRPRQLSRGQLRLRTA